MLKQVANEARTANSRWIQKITTDLLYEDGFFGQTFWWSRKKSYKCTRTRLVTSQLARWTAAAAAALSAALPAIDLGFSCGKVAASVIA